jgi:hypothetical protein
MAPHILADLATAIGLVAYQAVWPVFRPALPLMLYGTADHQLGKEEATYGRSLT